jgi:putative membrane protein
MKTPRRLLLGSLILLAAAPTLLAADTTTVPSWHAQTLWQAVGNLLIFACIGIVAAIVGYKVFDKCTPGNLTKEILEHRNVAAAIIAAAVILGVCIIVAAAMMG